MLAIALPMIVSNTCDTVMLFTDRLFLSRLGPEYMSASMGGGLTHFMIVSFFFGLIGYSTAVTAQFFGAGDHKKCPTVTFQAILIAVAAYPLILLLLLPAGHFLFNHSGIAPVQLVQQKPYFDILMVGSIIWLVKFAFNGFFSGVGKTRVILISSVCSMCTNVFMSYAMIFGKFGFPAMGIRGAAYSTVISSFVGLVIMVYNYQIYAKSNKLNLKSSFKYDREILNTIIKFGFSAGLEVFLTMSAFTAMIFMFHSKGLETATSVTIVFNWDHVAFVPLMGLEIGVTSLFGRYVGAERFDIAQKTIASGLKTGILYSLGIAIIFVIFPYMLTDIFRPEHYDPGFKSVEALAVFMIRTASIYVAVETLVVVYAGALRGAGDTFWAMLINVGVAWGMAILMYICLHVLDISMKTSWVLMVLIFLITPVLMYMRFQTGKWKTFKMVE